MPTLRCRTVLVALVLAFGLTAPRAAADPAVRTAARSEAYVILLPLVAQNVRTLDATDIQRQIDVLPASGGLVQLEPGEYVCHATLVIDRDNVQLRGAGSTTILRLADGANVPVLVLGGLAEQPTTQRRNIHVSDLTIDGNRALQDSEVDPINPYLRNNGISLRHVENCTVERVVIHSARSGGLVTEKGCRSVTVRDVTSYDNQYDGLAGYETEDSLFTHLQLFNNCAAGLSFDLGFGHNTLRDVLIYGDENLCCCPCAAHATSGIFMRDSCANWFHDITIRGCHENGVFLAQVNDDSNTPASGNYFSHLIVTGCGGAGLRVNDASCVDNWVIGAEFRGNAGGCISEVLPGLVHSFDVTCE